MRRHEVQNNSTSVDNANNSKSDITHRGTSNGKETNSKSKSKKKSDSAEERAQLVLWRSPIKTFYYFIREIPCAIEDTRVRLVTALYDPRQRSMPAYRKLLIFLALLGLAYASYFCLFKDDENSRKVKEQITWFSYWVFLGILSSVGLGTGLHTFLLYLGPFIAKVTVAAQECDSTNFPRPPYPDQVICPEIADSAGITVWDIMAKIRWESLMWGFGTALGELPPYFMARAARISGMHIEDEELEEFEELLNRKKKQDPSTLSWLERGKLWMEDIVEKVGFWGILACASIPNPLFDLAGITCGHFLVPFTTFFGATVIGKALVKTHLQMTFVILAFNEELLTSAVALIGKIPRVGPLISDPFIKLMDHQKMTLHNSSGKDPTGSEGGILAFILEKLVMGMVVYFIISIINSMAQSHHKRLQKQSQTPKIKE